MFRVPPYNAYKPTYSLGFDSKEVQDIKPTKSCVSSVYGGHDVTNYKKFLTNFSKSNSTATSSETFNVIFVI